MKRQLDTEEILALNALSERVANNPKWIFWNRIYPRSIFCSICNQSIDRVLNGGIASHGRVHLKEYNLSIFI